MCKALVLPWKEVKSTAGRKHCEALVTVSCAALDHTTFPTWAREQWFPSVLTEEDCCPFPTCPGIIVSKHKEDGAGSPLVSYKWQCRLCTSYLRLTPYFKFDYIQVTYTYSESKFNNPKGADNDGAIEAATAASTEAGQLAKLPAVQCSSYSSSCGQAEMDTKMATGEDAVGTGAAGEAGAEAAAAGPPAAAEDEEQPAGPSACGGGDNADDSSSSVHLPPAMAKAGLTRVPSALLERTWQALGVDLKARELFGSDLYELHGGMHAALMAEDCRVQGKTAAYATYDCAWAKEHCVDMTGRAFAVFMHDAATDIRKLICAYFPGEKDSVRGKAFVEAQDKAWKAGAFATVMRGKERRSDVEMGVGGKRAVDTDPIFRLWYAHNSSADEEGEAGRQALITFGNVVASFLEKVCNVLLTAMKAAVSGNAVALDTSAPWQLVSYTIRYLILQHVDTLDLPMSVIVWTTRVKPAEGEAEWSSTVASYTQLPPAAPEHLSDSMFIMSGLRVYFVIGHGDMVVFDTTTVLHGSTPMKGSTEAEEELLAKRGEPHGNALWVKQRDAEAVPILVNGITKAVTMHEKKPGGKGRGKPAGGYHLPRSLVKEVGAALAKAARNDANDILGMVGEDTREGEKEKNGSQGEVEAAAADAAGPKRPRRGT